MKSFSSPVKRSLGERLFGAEAEDGKALVENPNSTDIRSKGLSFWF
jgi:hypothetical protein